MGDEGIMRRRTFILLLFSFIAVFIGLMLIGIIPNNTYLHVLISLKRMLTGYAISLGISLFACLLLGSSKYLRMAVKPVLSFFMSIPTITWVPVLLVITGIGEKTIIISIFLGSFFAIVFNTLDGFDNINQSMVKAAHVMGYGRIEMFFKVFVPASFNNILVGLKLGIAYSWRALVGTEMLGATSFGLGYLVFASRKFYDIKTMIISLALIGSLGYLLNRSLVAFVERKTILKWGMN